MRGKINGLAREYYKNGRYKFVGKYLNDKKNGIFKEYDSDGNLEFECEYLNGEKSGKGKQYDFKHVLIFDGEFLRGKRWNGKGVETYNYRQYIFMGEYLNGEKRGKEFYNFNSSFTLDDLKDYFDIEKHEIKKENFIGNYILLFERLFSRRKMERKWNRP